MFGVGYNGNYQLHLIDVVNGALTTIGDSVGRPSGLAFIRIPEPPSIAIALTVVLILSAHRVDCHARFELRLSGSNDIICQQ